MDLFLELEYNVGQDKFEYNSNIADEHIPNFISNFLQTQIGKGKDEREANEHEVYIIRLELDMSNDTYFVSDNTGNKSLRDGILLHVVQNWKE